MKIHTFIYHVLQKMQEEMGDSIKVSLQDITKNNGVVLTGLTIAQKGVNISPTIYLEDFYDAFQNGKSMEEIMEEIKDVYYRSKIDKDINMDFFTEFNKAKGRIVYKLIHYDKNRELLKDIPHREYLDLAIVYYYLVDMEEFANATILIHNKHMENWNVTEAELYESAKLNTPQLLKMKFCGMLEILKELAGEDFLFRDEEENALREELLVENHNTADDIGMYVLSNRTRLYGAVTILYEGVMEECCEKLGGSFYILPSSVHEVILVPDNEEISKDNLVRMVREVNATQVEEQEQLSDFVYYYNAKTKGILRL